MVLVVFDASIHETKEAAAIAKEILRKEAIKGSNCWKYNEDT